MVTESQFKELELHLLDVNNGSADLDSKVIDDLVSRVSIDKAAVLQNPEDVKSLLTVAIAVLHNESLDIDFDKVIGVLCVVVSQLDFEDVTSSMFSFDYLLEALKSSNINLQILALKVATTADPLDVLADTEIVPMAIDLLSVAETPVRLVSVIENSLSRFIYSSLIVQRMLSGKILETLQKMSRSSDVTIKTRLLDLVVKLSSFVQEEELPKEVYLLDDIYSEDGDIMYTLNIIKFYKDLVDISSETLNKSWILINIKPQLLKISELYYKRLEIIDIEYFAVSAISQIFKSLSFSAPELLHEIDLKYIKLNKKDDLLLSTLNPKYLANYHASLLQELPLSIDNVPIFRNLLKDEEGFTLVKSQLTSPKLLRLPYLELVAVLEPLTKYPYGSKYLLTRLPQVMNKLLNGENVIETETFQLRKLTLENLNSISNEDLTVWKNAVHREYSLVVNGASNPGLAAPLTL